MQMIAGSSISISVLPPLTTCLILATEMLIFLSAEGFRVGFYSFLLEEKLMEKLL